MNVKMLVDTNYFGLKRINEEYEVPEDVARRWEKNGIAEIIQVVKINPEDLSAKELYKYCVEQGLEVEPKKQKEYYLEALLQDKEEDEITE